MNEAVVIVMVVVRIAMTENLFIKCISNGGIWTAVCFVLLILHCPVSFVTRGANFYVQMQNVF